MSTTSETKPAGRVLQSSWLWRVARRSGCLLLLLLWGAAVRCEAAAPVVSNVRASQRAGTELVDIYYDVSASVPPLTVSVQVSADGGATFAVNAVSLTGDVGVGLQAGSNKHVVWNAGADWDGQFSPQVRFKVTVTDSAAPAGMVLIPAGSFQMGNSTNPNEGGYELPVHTVYVSAFYMDLYEVTKMLWDDIAAWGLTHGYTDLSAGFAKGGTHPVGNITWYSIVKWCNARSEKENLTPVYYTDVAFTTVYRIGSANLTTTRVKWSANGYRLPTEAEWEKAARGGASGHRFPWSNVETITHSQANYYSSSAYTYDVSPTRGYHPTTTEGDFRTTPVGSFESNGYGLFDMAGNASERCWDVFDPYYYSTSPNTDPKGPLSGYNRVVRGGDFTNVAPLCRSSNRIDQGPDLQGGNIGARCVRR